MTSRRFLLHAFFISLVGLMNASSWAKKPEPVARIELRSDAMVTERNVKLADIAFISAANAAMKRNLEELRVGNAPMIGYVERLPSEVLDQLVRKRLPGLGGTVEWSGASMVNVRSASRLVNADAVVDVAKKYLQTELDARFEKVEIRLASPVADVELPLGDVAFKPRAVDTKRMHARMPVWIDMYVNGAFYRSMVVPLVLAVSRIVYVAKHDLVEGSFVSIDDFVAKTEETVSDFEDRITASELQTGFRVTKPLAAGQVLSRKDLSAKDTVFRGEQVKLVVAEGAVMVETPALVQQEARIGQLVKVKIEKGMDTVVGRLVSPGVVQAIGR